MFFFFFFEISESIPGVNISVDALGKKRVNLILK